MDRKNGLGVVLTVVMMLLLGVVTTVQAQGFGPFDPEGDGGVLDVQVAVAKAQVIMDRQEIPLPTVVRFGPRRGEPIKGGDQDQVNATIGLTQSTIESFMGRELFVYGIPVVGDSDDHAVRALVGRVYVAEAAIDKTVPLVTVQLDPEAMLSGSVNDYQLLTSDLGDVLVPEEPKPATMIAIMSTVAGRFKVISQVSDPALDKVVRSSASTSLSAQCRTSIFCVGFPIGRCRCYWDGTEWACGKPKANVTASCVGWCPG